MIEKSEEKPDHDWTDPVDVIGEEHHFVQLADQIATQIQRMLRSDTIPEEIGHSGTYNHRPITEGDILILVQRRSDLFAEIIRACKAAGLKVAGADRLRVGAELAVKDLTALLSFLALPEDDLSLASALKSPLFGWTEQDLFTLAHHRQSKYLWPALRDSDAQDATKAILTDLRQQADFLRPYDLIERILTRHDGRRKLLARLGSEAEDGIDALLSQALAYEGNGVPSLTGFLNWMATDDLEIKRQMDSQGDQIRVMTVHGAKGLEAPIVILPDTAKRPIRINQEVFTSGDTPLWKTPADATPPAISALQDEIKTKQAEERMRLLYVAMTRAEKWLIVAAAGDTDDDCWHSIVSDGMRTAGDVETTAGPIPIRRVENGQWQSGDLIAKTVSKQTQINPPTFGSLPEPTRNTTLSPSDLGGAKILPGDPGEGDKDAAMERGSLIHLLLEHLPLAAPEDRRTLGETLLTDHTGDTTLIDHVVTLLQTPSLAPIFTDTALTEVDITATLGPHRIHGTIDRLIITDAKVTAIDYKTNRLVPNTPDQTPEGLLRQMGAYATGLALVFPDHQIESAILWTETANLMPLPPDLTAAALARFTAP